MASPSRLPADRKRRMLVRAHAETDPSHGKEPSKRTLAERLDAGVINLDKPPGPSSHQVAAWLRKLVGAERVGHGGTLDPRVTGVLPVSLNHATRGIGALLSAGKEYVCVMRLHGDASLADVKKAAAPFVGAVQQTPPVRSAVARRRRTRQIYYLDVLEKTERDVLFRVGCQAGTYVRNLCVDIGKQLGTRGHMQQLRRTRTGHFGVDSAITLNALRDAWSAHEEQGDDSEVLAIVQPQEAIFAHLPKIVVRDSAVAAVCHGAALHAPGVVSVDEVTTKGSNVLIESLKGEAVALGKASLDAKALVAAEAGEACLTQRVLMPGATYPKRWKRRTRA